MAAAIVDAIGIFGTILGTIGFFQDNWAGSEPQGATVNIKAGLTELGNDGDNLGGSINHVYAFDERNGYSGQSDGCEIQAGGICTKTVDQSVAGRRAKYISISNNNDATCISWITVQQFDGTRGGAWTGDIGSACGQAWYNSIERAGRFKDDQCDDNGNCGGEYIPRCTWLDADHTNDIASAALKFDVAAYGENVLDTVGNDACAPTIYGADNAPIAGAPAKRSLRDRLPWMKEQLVVSNHTSQPASDLCNSATSWGPDFIGPDGQFCDMGSKTLTPLCSSQDVEGCVEVDEEGNNLVKRMNVARRSTSVVHKSYNKIQKWGY